MPNRTPLDMLLRASLRLKQPRRSIMTTRTHLLDRRSSLGLNIATTRTHPLPLMPPQMHYLMAEYLISATTSINSLPTRSTIISELFPPSNIRPSPQPSRQYSPTLLLSLRRAKARSHPVAASSHPSLTVPAIFPVFLPPRKMIPTPNLRVSTHPNT
jgi:hypothetical protein